MPTGWVGMGEVDGNPFFFFFGWNFRIRIVYMTYLTLGAKERILPTLSFYFTQMIF